MDDIFSDSFRRRCEWPGQIKSSLMKNTSETKMKHRLKILVFVFVNLVDEDMESFILCMLDSLASKKRKEKAKLFLVICKPTRLTITRHTTLFILFRHGNFKFSHGARIRRMEKILVRFINKQRI